MGVETWADGIAVIIVFGVLFGVHALLADGSCTYDGQPCEHEPADGEGYWH